MAELSNALFDNILELAYHLERPGIQVLFEGIIVAGSASMAELLNALHANIFELSYH